MSELVEQLSVPVAGPQAPAPDDMVDVLSRIPAEVLETMFFAEAVAAVCSHAWLSSAVGVRIRFAGSHVGEMRLSVSRDAADSIACAFLGLEPLELTEPLGAQVILELTNILCGAILSHVWPESKVALGARKYPPRYLWRSPLSMARCTAVSSCRKANWQFGSVGVKPPDS